MFSVFLLARMIKPRPLGIAQIPAYQVTTEIMDMVSAYLLEETGGALPTGYILRKERGDFTKKRKQILQERVYPFKYFPAIA